MPSSKVIRAYKGLVMSVLPATLSPHKQQGVGRSGSEPVRLKFKYKFKQCLPFVVFYESSCHGTGRLAQKELCLPPSTHQGME